MSQIDYDFAMWRKTMTF